MLAAVLSGRGHAVAMPGRGGARLRKHVRQYQWRALRRSGSTVILLVVLAYPLIVALALTSGALLSAIAGVWPPWLAATGFRRGVVVGATIAGAGWWTREMSQLLGAGAERQRKGAEGEELTDRALRPLRWRGWRVVHDIEFPGEGNVDHLLIGPRGIVAIDSKYTTERLWVTPKAIGGSHRRHIGDAGRATSLARRALAGVGHPDVQVESALMFWGPGAPEVEGGHAVIQGTLVVEGRRVRLWRRSLGGRSKVLDRSTAKAIARNLRSYRPA